MNTRLIKETRDLLPVFAGMLPLIVVPQLIWPLAGFGYLALGVACVVMAGSSFGNEFQHRTLSLLLSQPIARSVIWREKMIVLGAGMLASLLVLMLCLQVRWPGFDREGCWMLALIPMCAFCGAPFWTLSLRHGIAGMVFAVVAPGGILAVIALISLRLGGALTDELWAASLVLLVIYCALVYWRGYATFKRLEAVDGPTRELSLPAGLEAFFVRPLTRASSGFRGPFATLLKKEFRLQQISFLVAGLFVLFAVAGACLIQRHHDLAEAIIVGDCFICVLIVPLIAGATAVAEEKGWGIAEWHLTLPPSALNQWSAKMLAALSTSLALGLLLPTALFLAANALLDKHGMRSGFAPVPELLGFMLGSLLLTCVAVYAASFSNTTLRAILVAFALIAASLGAATLVGHGMYKTFRIFGLGPTPSGEAAPLALCAGFILLLCLTQWFAWSNFRRSRGPARRLVIQFLAILLAVGLITAAVVVAPYLDRILDPRLIYSH
jgi:ABC-type transport system involved in multi-copper enzyme maturation permease subunit